MKSHSTRLFTLLAAIVLLATSALALQAQSATPEATPAATAEATTVITDLTYNTAVTGVITDANPTQLWPLQAPSADRINVRVERLDGNLLPAVQVLDATGSAVGQSYGPDKTGAVAQTRDFKLASGGQYQVQVSRKDADKGVTTGQYRLTVIADATAQDNINNTTVIGPVTAGTPINGEVTSTHWYQLYTYTAEAPDTLTITAQRTSGSLMPMIYLLDTNGSSITTGYTTNVGDSATIDSYTLPAAGQYTIAVSRYNDYDGDTVGQYTLNLTLVGAGVGSKSLTQTTGTVEYDQELTGEISGAQWYQDWTLTAKAGDSLSIAIKRTSGTLKPTAAILGGSGQNLNQAYVSSTGDSASFDLYTLQTPGTYTVRASRDGDQDGTTTGKYALVVHLIGSGEGSPDLSGSTGTITTGTPVNGKVTNVRWADTWTYQGTAGDQLKIGVKRTDGTLIPMIELRDVNGQNLTTAYPDPSMDTASITYRIPATGAFQIVVERDGQQNGLTNGGYELTVAKAAE